MKNKTSNEIPALLIGIAIGAIAAVLLAPDKGSETRNKLKNFGGSIQDKAAQKFEKLTGFKDKMVSTLKSKSNGLVEEYLDDQEHA